MSLSKGLHSQPAGRKAFGWGGESEGGRSLGKSHVWNREAITAGSALEDGLQASLRGGAQGCLSGKTSR